eukprot:scaffold3772_cov390-Prasinococcus_capsulatus_cf.AAC.6
MLTVSVHSTASALAATSTGGRRSLRCNQAVVKPASALFTNSSFLGSVGALRCARRSTSEGLSRRSALQVSAIFDNLNLDKVFNVNPAEKTRKAYQDKVDVINGLEGQMKQLSDEQLRAKTDEFKKRVEGGETLDSLLPEAFAVAREASWRVLGLRPFDVQLIGGIILHEGKIAEMRTGEGKTLVSVLPAYLNALGGKGVHIVTVNDYLARRDMECMGQVHRYLGLSVGLIQQDMETEVRQKEYQADITYVTNSELGFDYLRDNLASEVDELVLRGFNFCIIDEVDSILIDEARTPLIISGQAEKASDKYIKASKIAKVFERDVHYTVDEKQKSVLLSEEGYEAAEEILQVQDLYNPREQWASYVINAIKAKELQLKDVSYIVKNGEVLIVDEFTGRVMEGRRWSDGLHQAVEAKEGLPIQAETITLASVSYQNFFLGYEKLAGMTGTAATENTEFENIYNLQVVVVPTNRENNREDYSDVVFMREDGKWKAVAQEIGRMHKRGRPVLVGTTSVEVSELLAEKLAEKKIPHQVLNAKPENVQRESEIIAQSGRKSQVTISTNMAGRGTDILLGGNPEFMARLKVRSKLMPLVVAPTEDDMEQLERRKITAGSKSWEPSKDLFPVELSAEAEKILEESLKAITGAYGKRSMTELEAEDKLSVACEKAPIKDEALASLRQAFERITEEYKAVTSKEKEEVIQLGGLHVVGTERHESRRIDNQLRGRSGRQGDPGTTRFFLSLEDNLFRIFGGDRIKSMMTAFSVEDLPIESSMLTGSLDQAQKKVETYFYDMRKQLYEFDQVLDSQRKKVYRDRATALKASQDTLAKQMVIYAELTVDDILEANIPREGELEDELFEATLAKFTQYCGEFSGITVQQMKTKYAEGYEELREFMREVGRQGYYKKVDLIEQAQPGLMVQAQRYFIISQIDRMWKEHLQAMKFVQQAVGLRGYAQRDPLTEYKLEGFRLFQDMMVAVRRNVIYSVYQFKAARLEKVEEEEEVTAESK